jgi:hypothetical protein
VIAYPTLLRRRDLAPTVDLNIMAAWPETNYLPLDPSDYAVKQLGEVWRVRTLASGTTVYQGAGPVELIECPVPF